MPKYHGKNQYLGAWGYVFLDILYAIPLLGFIFLLIHAFDSKKENRMHYARCHFVRFLLVLIISVIALAALYLLAGSEVFVAQMEEFSTTLNEYVNAIELPIN